MNLKLEIEVAINQTWKSEWNESMGIDELILRWKKGRKDWSGGTWWGRSKIPL